MRIPVGRAVAAVFSLSLLAASAEAVPFHIEFSTLGLAEGQSFEGSTVDIATFTSEDASLAYTGAFGEGLRTSGGSSWDVCISFASPIGTFSIRAGDGAGGNDAFALRCTSLAPTASWAPSAPRSSAAPTSRSGTR